MTVRFISSHELHGHLDLSALMDWLAEQHRQAKAEVADQLIGDVKARFLVRSAGLAGNFGSKLITIVPDNPERGLPSVQAVMTVFDRETGVLRAVLEATEMTYWKTVADSGLASRILSRPDSRTLLMCGAGGLAPWLIRAHLAARPSISRIIIWNRTRMRAEALTAELSPELQAKIEVADDLERAVREADIISTATMAREPFLRGEWLKPGQHLDLVGSFGPGTRESDDECVRRARVFVDSREAALHGVGDILGPIRSGALREEDILADHYQLAQGAPGRTSPEDTTLFKNAGGAHLDLMTAAFFLDRLRA